MNSTNLPRVKVRSFLGDIMVVVVGNVTLDIICQTVDEVPRHDSIAFERAKVSPGGCGSNVALGISASGIQPVLVACCGVDNAATLIETYWREAGINIDYLERVKDIHTGTSVGLVDSDYQPRFIHTTGANAKLTPDKLDIPSFADIGARFIHTAGYFVLPGLLDVEFADKLEEAKGFGMFTSLDVVRSPRMDTPEVLWPCLPHLDIFMCNEHEGSRITGQSDPHSIAEDLRARGSSTVIIKLGKNGCWLENEDYADLIPGSQVNVVDTTGAGDAFAAGLITALMAGGDIRGACLAGNAAGGKIAGSLGAIAGWGYK